MRKRLGGNIVPRSLKILLVEDNPGDARLLEEYLKDADTQHIELVPVDQLSEARKYLAMTKFDLVLLDVTLPDSDGLETFMTLHQEASEVPIIVLTGRDDETMAMKTLQMGAQDYLVKGHVDGDLIFRAIRYAMERKRVEVELLEQQRILSTLMSNLPGMAYRCKNDEAWTMLFVSEGSYNLTGYQSEELIHNKNIAYGQLIHPEDREQVNREVHCALQEGRHFRVTYRIKTAQGQEKWVWEQGQGIFTPKNELKFIEGFISDITDLKLAKEKVRKTEMHLQHTIEHMLKGYQIIDRDWRYLHVNKAVLKQARTTEVVGKTVMEVFPGIERSDIFSTLQECMQERKSAQIESQFEYPNGDTAWFELSIQPVPEGIFILSHDITERKQAEEIKLRLASIVETTDDAIIGMTLDGAITSWNSGAERIFGYSSVEARELSISVLFPNERKDEVRQILKKLTRGEHIIQFETTWLKKNRAHIHVSLTISPITNSEGRIIGASTVSRDITQTKEAAEKLKEYAEELQRSNRELQDFASIASHDLQEPLRKVIGFSEFLKDEYGDILKGEGRDYLERMQKAAERMNKLISDLLAFSRVMSKAKPFAKVNLASLVKEVLQDLDLRIQELDANVDVSNLPAIDADKTQMYQLFQNLINNALKFRKQDIKPVVKLRHEILNGGETGHSGRNSKKYCKILVEDNGIGFEEKYLDRIFTIFQRLHNHNEYEGTGIGLAVCRRIAERHGGAITATSKPEQGATFIITLPVTHNKGEKKS